MAANDDLEQKLKAGVEAARRGDRVTARRLLEQVVSVDENNELAWIWLASSVNTLSERRACLEKVLQINPNNTRAKEALQNLGASAARSTVEQDSQVVDQLRRAQRRPPPSTPRAVPPAPLALEEPRRGLNVAYIGVIVLLLVVVAGGVLLTANLSRQAQVTPTQDIFAAAANTTATDTPVPASPTPYIVTVETRTAPTLPPTFTPTDTPTATATPTPTITPYPVELFSLLYTSLEPGAIVPDLYRINGDGSGEQKLASNIREVAYDPSGKKIAFVRDVTHPAEGDRPEVTTPEIFVAPADNLDAAVQITSLKSTITGHPSWAPDGVRIVFVSNYDGDEELWSMTDDGLNVTQLTNNEKGIDRDPAWSPDGKTIIFASDLNTPGLTEIYRLRLPEAEDEQPVIEQLTDDNGSSYSPAWSPDGSRMVFISDRSGDGDVYLADANGQRPFLLTSDDGGAEDRSPVFSPDGRWVSFVSNRDGDIFQIYMVNLRGTELVRLTNTRRDDQSLAYRPELLLRLREGEA